MSNGNIQPWHDILWDTDWLIGILISWPIQISMQLDSPPIYSKKQGAQGPWSLLKWWIGRVESKKKQRHLKTYKEGEAPKQ